jgi:hypothetical protein
MASGKTIPAAPEQFREQCETVFGSELRQNKEFRSGLPFP